MEKHTDHEPTHVNSTQITRRSITDNLKSSLISSQGLASKGNQNPEF